MVYEEQIVTCPTSVNLIGDQLAYNGGVIISLNLGKKFTMKIKSNTDDGIELIFPSKTIITSVKEAIEQDPKVTAQSIEDEDKLLMSWVVRELKKNNLNICSGFKAKYNFDVESYEKNSTSIAFGLLTFRGINMINKYNLSDLDIERMNEDIQINMGKGYRGSSESFMMNMPKENCGCALYCQSLKHEHIPMNYDGYSIIVSFNDNLKNLTFEKDKIRQCDEALQKFQKVVNISSLCNLSITEFEKFKGVLDKDALKVATYVVYENHRVKGSIEKLKDGSVEDLGELMKKSHEDLKELYGMVDVKHDFIFEEAMKVEGCIGSKTSESTFGMCNLSIIKNEAVEDFKEKVGGRYNERFNEDLKFYVEPLKNKYQCKFKQ